MKNWTRLGVLAALAIGLLSGVQSGGASTNEACSEGRPFCVTITDDDGVSLSTGDTRYLSYAVTVRNTGTSRLTNGVGTLTLTDLVGSSEQASTAVFQPADSDGDCSFDVDGNVLTFTTIPNIRGGASFTCDPLVFSSSTTAAATATKLVADFSFKEKGSDNQPSDPNQDRVVVSESTTYETSGDVDTSYARAGKTTNLGTDPSDNQSTKFAVPVPANGNPFVASVSETGVSGSFCPGCLGEIVHTVGGGIFSNSNPIQLLTTWDFLPQGKNQSNITITHIRDDGSSESITDSCGGEIGELPPVNKRPCRTVEIDRGPNGTVTVVIYIVSNGNGQWGIS